MFVKNIKCALFFGFIMKIFYIYVWYNRLKNNQINFKLLLVSIAIRSMASYVFKICRKTLTKFKSVNIPF